MFINIVIKSKNKNSILKFLKIFKNFSKSKKLHLSRVLIFFQANCPENVFTILKSPHVNKRAQEQFEFTIYSQKIQIRTFQITKTLIVLKKIQGTFFSEIELDIKFLIDKTQKNKLMINNFSPDRIGLNNKNTFKQVELYLWLFNFYGKHKFRKLFK